MIALLLALQETRPLGFETDADLRAWEIEHPARLVAEHATVGERALRVELPATDWPGIALAPRDADWSAFDALVADVWNPTERILALSVRIDDADSRDYGTRYNEDFPLAPGANRLELALTGLRTSDGARTIDLGHIQRLILFLGRPGEPVTLTFDGVALVRAERPPDPAFDFGPEGSPVWSGFTPVTPETLYTRERGYGFERAGANFRDRRHPNELLGDWVELSRAFLLDLPNGEYEAYLFTEDAGYWEWYPHAPRREFRVQGEAAFVEELTADEFLARYFRHLETEDLPGEDVWETYVEPRFAPRVVPCRVRDGRLRIEAEPAGAQACVLSALIVVPRRGSREGRRWVDGLDRRMRERFRRTYVEVPRGDPAPAGMLPDYVVFSPHPSELPYPRSVPPSGPPPERLEAFAARGESEPLAISVYPRRDIGRVRVEVEGIPARVRWVQYKLKRLGAAGNTYDIRPELLRETEPPPSAPEIVRTFWVTLEGREPGDHDGVVRVIPERGGERAIPLRFHVYPFELPDADIPLGMFYYPLSYLRWYPETEARYGPRIEASLADMRAHGMTSVGSYVGGEELAEFRRLYDRAGFPQPMLFGYGERASRDEYVAGLREAARATGEGAIANLLDEPSNTGGIGRERARELLEWAREVRGLRITGALNHDGDEALFGLMDLPMFNDGMGIGPELLAQAGRPILYNLGRGRLSWGFYLARVGAAGRFEFAYEVGQSDPYYDLDARESDLNAAYPGPEDRPIASVSWELIREGVDDYRYALALRRADPAALEEILREVDPAWRANGGRDACWCDGVRRRIAERLGR